MKHLFKHPLFYVALFGISSVLHNLWYALFGFEEAVFLLTASIIAPIGFIVSSIVWIIKRIKPNKK